MNPPAMGGWNLALRFGLELAALAGLAVAAWDITSGTIRWIAAVGVVVVAAAVWGTFNVPDDPSRSGAAPVVVSGSVRLGLEFVTLGAGVAGWAITGHPVMALAFSILIVFHYGASTDRIHWLLSR